MPLYLKGKMQSLISRVFSSITLQVSEKSFKKFLDFLNCSSRKFMNDVTLNASFWGLLGLIFGNLIFQELKFFRIYF